MSNGDDDPQDPPVTDELFSTRREAGYRNQPVEVGTLNTPLQDFAPPVQGHGVSRPTLPGVGQPASGDPVVARGYEPAPPAARRGRAAPNWRLDTTIDLTTGDPALDAAARQVEDVRVGIDVADQELLASGLTREAQILAENANRERMAAETARLEQEERRQETRRTFDELSEMNAAVMDQRINPARFFTSGGAGTGLAAAASVALGVLGQALNPGMENSALAIINRAVDRDIAAQVQDIQTQQFGVGMARNLYGDLLTTYQQEDVAREALRSLYFSEMERRIAALAAQTQSQVTRNNAQRLRVAVAEQRVTAAATAARARTRTIYTSHASGRQPVGSRRGITSAARQMQADSPLTATAVAQAMQQHGVPLGVAAMTPAGAAAQGMQPPAAPGAQSPDASGTQPPTGGRVTPPATPLTPEDIRSRDQNAAAAADATEEAAELGRGGSDEPGAAPWGREQSRRNYRSSVDGIRGGQGVVVPSLTRIVVPDGSATGAIHNVISTGNQTPTSGGGYYRSVIQPITHNGRMVAVSSSGRSRAVSPGDALRRGERLAGVPYRHHFGSMPAEMARHIRQTENPVRIMGVGTDTWYAPAALAQTMDANVLEEEITGMQLLQQGRESATKLAALIDRSIGQGVALNTPAVQGAASVHVMALQGIMGDLSNLGTLQAGEREIINQMTSLGIISEDYLEFFPDIDRSRASVGNLRNMFNVAMRRSRLADTRPGFAMYRTGDVESATAEAQGR